MGLEKTRTANTVNGKSGLAAPRSVAPARRRGRGKLSSMRSLVVSHVWQKQWFSLYHVIHKVAIQLHSAHGVNGKHGVHAQLNAEAVNRTASANSLWSNLL